MKFKSKLCGITCAEDLQIAIDFGFSAVGMIHYESSPRHLSITEMLDLRKIISSGVQLFIVLVDEPLDSVLQMYAQIKPDVIQLHGGEDAAYIDALRSELGSNSVYIVKAIRVGNQDLSTACDSLNDYVDCFLFDTYRKGRPGGTGETFNWSQLASLSLRKPYILSGGLSASNITDLVNAATQWKQMPIGLDYNSGLEKSPGRKCSKKISELIHEMNRLGVNDEGAILA